MTATLDALANDGVEGEGDHIYLDVEAVVGGSAGDTLTGSAEADGLFGGPGPDTLEGRGGADVIDGEADNDTILARDGAVDDIDCGAGTDTAIVDSADKVVGCETVSTPPPRRHRRPRCRRATLRRPRSSWAAQGCSASCINAACAWWPPAQSRPCIATAKGRIVIRGSSKRFKLRPATKQIAQGAKATLELTLRKTTLTAIRRALKQGKKVSAKLTVTAKDAYGNPNTEQRTVKLKR